MTRGNENPDAKQYTENNNDTVDACIGVCSVLIYLQIHASPETGG
ncbi:hypothetical protein [Lacticaseibacillus rhamnosus]|uniref:Uncharacterized protein n=1 Tax=Lacticaseibacillus rhamnosus (strain LMS2-1) TaxID=525361 RepID=C2JV07_LACRM|nr:hypothetical protein [Lacticaseibacillus rhamnosus]AER65401.1 conserved hypothetical protein [Lacticaseibacillus rhamnosus ATCC 8530]AGP75259.1 Hypothetical protein LOCK908_2652 [Lacticaseibacillus rhamnosus LOCK908]EEN81108.1 hypothetical protein HMPREF0539_0741 [Lacticaseibacillus rhamnosus LMS2-1]MDU8970239.1 hypothetical protein [Lacticaseibacillus rhamnosus]MDZ5418406.1 hypothetical protein [Lacticaseibacillus rhamnosus]